MAVRSESAALLRELHLHKSGVLFHPDEGGAEMVEHVPQGGGAVFSVGSICWPASILVDDAVSQITANAIHRYLAD